MLIYDTVTRLFYNIFDKFMDQCACGHVNKSIMFDWLREIGQIAHVKIEIAS